MFVRPVVHMDQHAWTLAHTEAFRFFGGVPRRLVPDNLKTGVDKPDLYDPKINRSYAELASYYGTLVDPARASKPQDKPRVERPMPYVRDSFWSGRTFTSLEHMQAEALLWATNVAGERQCRPLGGAKPLSGFEAVEAKALLPMPEAPFVLARWSQATVGPDIHIKVGRTLYSVPWKLIGRRVDVRSTATMVQVFHEGELVKTHAALEQGKRTDKNDYPPEKIAFQMRTPIWCRGQASQVGDACREVIDQLLEVNALYRLRAAQGVLGLRKKYGDTRLEAACRKAVAVGDPSYRTVKGILDAGTETDPEPETGDAGPRPSCTAPRACSPPLSPCRSPAKSTKTRVAPTPMPRRPAGERDDHRPARVTEDAAAVRHAGNPRRPLIQAQKGELGHLDFLQVLCQDEITRRESVSLERRLRKAKFEQQATLEGFDFAASPKLPSAQIRDLAALRWLHSGESVILFGPVGVGKTHVAQALGHQAVRQGANVRFTQTSRILSELAGGHADRTWDKRMRELIRPDPLILDDFAMRQLTASQADDLYELVSERQGRSLIITSNRAPSDWYPLFPNPVVAESLLDRLINASHQVIMNGPSYRPNKRPRNPADKPDRSPVS